MLSKYSTTVISGALVLVLGGCASDMTSRESTGSGLSDRLKAFEQENKELRKTVASLQQKTGAARRGGTTTTAGDGDLLPPKASSGECYARVWEEPTYKKNSKRILVSEASEKINVIPARYRWVTKRVKVGKAGSTFKYIPPVYRSVKERILVRESARRWQIDLKNNAAPASEEVLARAKKHGIDLDAARSGTCYHEHYLPGLPQVEYKNVKVQPASDGSLAKNAYRWTEKRVLVRDAYTKLKKVPATYTWAEERILEKPAHSVWKKGTGPIQRIDEATGEIMCLVEVPAKYKTIRKRVLKSPARTERVKMPAEYKTVRVRELVVKEQGTRKPARYKKVKIIKGYDEGRYVWHEIHNRDHPAKTRTGLKVCLVETPAKYETVTRSVIQKEGFKTRINVPEKFKTIKVREEIAPAQERRIAVPAKYKTVYTQQLEREGRMVWRSILCKTNMTKSRITSIQRALKVAGFNPGPIDGVVGRQTMSAVNRFQRSRNLPVDRYLNMQTVRALGIS